MYESQNVTLYGMLLSHSKWYGQNKKREKSILQQNRNHVNAYLQSAIVSHLTFEPQERNEMTESRRQTKTSTYRSDETVSQKSGMRTGYFYGSYNIE